MINIIAIIMCVLALFFVIIPFFRQNRLNRLRERNFQNLENFEYVISVNGLMGKGKTSFSVGLIHDLTVYIQMKLTEELNKTVCLLKNFDFVSHNFLFEEEINKYLEKNNYMILHAIDDFINVNFEEDLNYLKTSAITNYLNVDTVYDLLVKYYIRYYCLNIRGILIYSKGNLFNRITMNNAKLMDDSGLEMVNSLDLNNWQFEIASIYFDDELSITRGNVFSGKKEYKLSGLTITLSLIRNMGLGTVYRISTKQKEENEEKQSRDLTGNNLEFIKIKTRRTYALFRFLIDFLDKLVNIVLLFFRKTKYKIKNFFIRLRNLFSKKKIDYYDLDIVLYKFQHELNVYRKIHYCLTNISNLLFSLGYNYYSIKSYYSSSDMGKENTKEKKYYVKYKFLFPLNYVYGNYDTYEYFKRLFKLEEYSINKLNIEFLNNQDHINNEFIKMIYYLNNYKNSK